MLGIFEETRYTTAATMAKTVCTSITLACSFKLSCITSTIVPIWRAPDQLFLGGATNFEKEETTSLLGGES